MAKEKFKSADDVAAEYMELQLSKSKESRFENVFVSILTLGFVFIFAVLFWVLPDRAFSEDENKSLQGIPEFTWESFLHLGPEYDDTTLPNGKVSEGKPAYQDKFVEYMADQFPLRNFFVGLKGLSEAVQFKGQNNGVIIADDGYLVARTDYPDEETLTDNIGHISKFASTAEKHGINCTIAFAGRKMDVMDEVLPNVYGSYYADRTFNVLDGICSDKGIDYLNLRDTLNNADEESLYYKTDHHWTSLGAYYAYCDIAKKLGVTPYKLSDFEVETATEEFYGTTWSSAGIKWTDPDTIEYFRWEGDEDLVLKIENPKYEYKDSTKIEENGISYDVFNTCYVREMLEGKDKYASFLGGNNNGYVEITMIGETGAPVEGRETLVLIRDSFADSLAPFLARHYNLILIDMRTQTAFDTIGLCKEKGVDNILILYNMETLTTTEDMKNLRFKLTSYDK